MAKDKIKLGLIINPVAGIGGKVGLKGSDGEATQCKARELGATPESNKKASIALKKMAETGKDRITIYTYPQEMGEDAAQKAGFETKAYGKISHEHTTAKDTMHAAVELRDAGVDLILFAGGDGTARNVLDAVGTTIPVLGIPAGCKIHSAVYALNPKTAGDLMAQYIDGKVKETKDSEVMDIDEDLFRENVVDAKLYGYLKVPNERKMVQNLKSGRGYSEEASISQIVNYFNDSVEEDTLYIIGPGSTTFRLMEKMELKGTLLGVDLVYNRKIVKNDATEKDILAALDQYEKSKIVVTVIGGQGYVFGRGNQQLSSDVIRKVGKENIEIVASKDKMLSMFKQGEKGTLHVDTNDDETNDYLAGFYKVLVAYEEYMMMKVDY